MERKWKINDDFIFGLVSIWLFGWIPIYLVLNWLEGTHSKLLTIFPYVWFGAVVVPVVLFGLFRFTLFMWISRPRRVTEPVKKDLREA